MNKNCDKRQPWRSPASTKNIFFQSQQYEHSSRSSVYGDPWSVTKDSVPRLPQDTTRDMIVRLLQVYKTHFNFKWKDWQSDILLFWHIIIKKYTMYCAGVHLFFKPSTGFNSRTNLVIGYLKNRPVRSWVKSPYWPRLHKHQQQQRMCRDLSKTHDL